MRDITSRAFLQVPYSKTDDYTELLPSSRSNRMSPTYPRKHNPRELGDPSTWLLETEREECHEKNGVNCATCRIRLPPNHFKFLVACENDPTGAVYCFYDKNESDTTITKTHTVGATLGWPSNAVTGNSARAQAVKGGDRLFKYFRYKGDLKGENGEIISSILKIFIH